MTSITVNQASDYTRTRDSNRYTQRKIDYKDLVLYVELKTMDSLAESNGITEIEEWMLDVNNKEVGDVALSIHAENNATYSLYSWVSAGESQRPSVVETPLSKAAFTQLKSIGVKGFYYRRHRFDIPYTKNAWLADVFTNQTGESHPWIRLTLAAEEHDTEMPTVPFAVNDHLFEHSPSNTAEEEERIRKLWTREWMSIEKS